MNKKTPQEKEVIQKAVEPQNALQQDTVPLNLPEDAQQGAPMVLQAPKGGGKMGRLNQLIDVSGWEEGEFMDDVRQATLRGAHPLSKILFWGLGVCLLLLYLWATFAQVEEVTRGEGKVIPSGQVRKIQHQEGGMVQEILARQGQVVDRGEPLIVPTFC